MDTGQIIRSLERVEELLRPIGAGLVDTHEIAHRINNARQIVQGIKLEVETARVIAGGSEAVPE